MSDRTDKTKLFLIKMSSRAGKAKLFLIKMSDRADYMIGTGIMYEPTNYRSALIRRSPS